MLCNRVLYLYCLSLLSSNIWYRDGMCITMEKTLASSPWSEFISWPSVRAMQASKTLLQRSPPVLKWGCRLTPVDLYNGLQVALVVYWTVARLIMSGLTMCLWVTATFIILVFVLNPVSQFSICVFYLLLFQTSILFWDRTDQNLFCPN